MAYTFQAYDILQVRWTPTTDWLDFYTLREPSEARKAVAMVDSGQWDGRRGEFRIVRDVPTFRGTVVYLRGAMEAADASDAAARATAPVRVGMTVTHRVSGIQGTGTVLTVTFDRARVLWADETASCPLLRDLVPVSDADIARGWGELLGEAIDARGES